MRVPALVTLGVDSPSLLATFPGGDSWIQVRQLLWTSTGWPVTGPPLVPVPGAPLSTQALAF
jgi:hypothetical protein